MATFYDLPKSCREQSPPLPPEPQNPFASCLKHPRTSLNWTAKKRTQCKSSPHESVSTPTKHVCHQRNHTVHHPTAFFSVSSRYKPTHKSFYTGYNVKRRSKIRDLPHGIGQPFDTRPVQHPIAVHLAVPWLLYFQFLVIRYLETISRVILRVYTTGHSVVACQPKRRYLRLCKATFVWGCCACSWQQSVIIATTCRVYDLPCVCSFLWSASFY